MRLDKYLKTARIIKRRTVAQSACEGGLVLVNGRPQKSAYKVKIGDEIEVKFGRSPLTVRVAALTETVRKDQAGDMYEVIAAK
ncbi:MAG: RNA-binding S4 domain-containing protein [Clostridia bacterium]|nr:RNA-binding S4 domain-containing protein [Clostridia bacterium]